MTSLEAEGGADATREENGISEAEQTNCCFSAAAGRITDQRYPRKKATEIFKANLLQTISYWSAFLTFGMCVAVLGPTLLDLGCLTKSTIQEMSWVLFAQTGFTLVGSVAAGYLANKVNPNGILLVSTIAISVCMCIVPECRTRLSLLLVFVVMGFFMGQIDTVANVRLLQIYGPLVAPFLQALHFAYGLGAFLSPIIAEPFLLNEDCSDLVSDLEQNNATNSESRELEKAESSSSVGRAYWAYALLQIPAILLVFATLIVQRRSEKRAELGASMNMSLGMKDKLASGSYQEISEHFNESSSSENDESEKGGAGEGGGHSLGSFSLRNGTLIALTAILLFLGDAAQAAYGGYIYTYAEKNEEVELSSTMGAYLTATFWGSFALGRLLSIPVSACTSPSSMLFGNISGSGGAMLLLYFFPGNTAVVFVSSALFGLFLSSIYPSAIAMAEQYISITGLMTSILVMGAASGEMTSPLILGWLLTDYGPKYLIYYEMLNSVLSLFILVVIVTISFKTITSKKRKIGGSRERLLSAYDLLTSD